MTHDAAKQLRTPHHRLTFKDVQKDYQAGFLTPKGAIFYAVSASRRPGTPIRITVDKFCSDLGISKSAYYRAIAVLSVEKRLNFAAKGEMYLWVPIEETTGIPEYIFLGELSLKRDSNSQMGDSNSQMGDSNSQMGDSNSQMGDSNSQMGEHETPKPASNGGSRASSIDSIDPVSFSLSLLEKDTEREIERLDPDFRKWLLNKARSLPKEPALLEQWVQKQAQNEANQREFREYQASRERAKVPPPPPAANFEFAAPQSMSMASRLAYYQQIWDSAPGMNGMKLKMQRDVEAHPEWGIAIGDRGPEEVKR